MKGTPLPDDSPLPALADEASVIVAMAAHEIKNVLGGLGVALARCEQRLAAGGAVQAEDLALARAEVRRLSNLVNDLLDGTRIDLGRLEVRPAPFDLCAMVRELAATFRDVHGRPMTLSVTAGLVIEADAERIRSVLVNYLENAAKYAPPPASIDLEIGPSPLGSEHLRLAVRDTGPGIRLEDQGRLFDRFFRATPPGSRTAGLGLGLHLCRTIAEAHGGAVGVESQPGAGATFWIDLPWQR
jgi:signal transduction histidine kinase